MSAADFTTLAHLYRSQFGGGRGDAPRGLRRLLDLATLAHQRGAAEVARDVWLDRGDWRAILTGEGVEPAEQDWYAFIWHVNEDVARREADATERAEAMKEIRSDRIP